MSKKIGFLFSVVLLLYGCFSDEKEPEMSFKDAQMDVAEKEIIPIDTFVVPKVSMDKYCKYQTFDEHRMCGIGYVRQEPYVWVYKTDSLILVKRSDMMDSTICYRRHELGWVNHIELERWKLMTGWRSCKCPDRNAENFYSRTYDRLLLGDTIAELQSIYYDSLVVGDFYILKIHNKRYEMYYKVKNDDKFPPEKEPERFKKLSNYKKIRIVLDMFNKNDTLEFDKVFYYRRNALGRIIYTTRWLN